MSPITLCLKAHREAKGWSQGDLAERAGVTRATVNRLENHVPASIDFSVLEKLADALDVSAPELLVHERAGKSKRGRKG